ncbi:hypothetical protein P0R31_17035 [Bradyrhizobium yuanmingense]|uniref:hypothetical protein n=1 Tax=Bradyrhizobium yuanmingense TaxID=108015 RepID=UPI0023B89224|nr:hypothetical protein [Bradyrhizobium yuanmingense]MDF0518941.1 hypothetical protein [Bradyrhizobium yuanmingense]
MRRCAAPDVAPSPAAAAWLAVGLPARRDAPWLAEPPDAPWLAVLRAVLLDEP